MNHKQISSLKEGDIIELIEDYEFYTEFGSQTIFKGTKMTFIYPVLGAWRFQFSFTQRGRFFGDYVNLGRSRLLKMKVRISEGSTQ